MVLLERFEFSASGAKRMRQSLPVRDRLSAKPPSSGKAGPAGLAAVAVVGYVVQVVLARAWMRRFRFGPAEWCWRSLTYGKVQPFRLTTSAIVESANV